jgi:4'-phosphopantetheinyl transferase
MDNRVHFSVLLMDRFSGKIDAYVSNLPLKEQKRALSYHRTEDRDRFIVARTWLRMVCARITGIPAREIPICYTANGRPFLDPIAGPVANNLDFNLSHSGNCIAICWSLCGPVGIDVEVAKPLPEETAFDLADTIFSLEERSGLRRSPREDVEETFYRIWVRKEAVLKAEGCGVGGPTQCFSVLAEQSGTNKWLRTTEFEESKRLWNLFEISTAPGHWGCVATRPHCVLEEVDLSG